MDEPVAVLLMARTLGAGGTERQLAEMAMTLDRDRFRVHVACFHDDGFRAPELRAAGIPILPLPVRSLYSSQAIRGIFRLRDYIRRHRIRLVHTFDAPMNFYGVVAARLCRVPVVLSSQRSLRSLRTPRERLQLRLSDRLVDGIVVNCAAVRSHLIEEEGVPSARIHLCYNGIDGSRFQPHPRPGPHRLAGDTVVIGTATVLRPEKGLGTLLTAFARLDSPDPGVRLAIVGSGPEEQRLKELACRLNIQDRCRFEAATPDVAPWLRSFDIFVLPSLSEALSNSLMEAMACGCIPVASRVGGNPELVSHQQTGLLFKAGDADELAGHLKWLLANRNCLEALASSASSFVLNHFSRQAAAGRMAAIYTEQLRKR